MITALLLPFLFLTLAVVCTILVPWWLQIIGIFFSVWAALDCVSVLRQYNALKDKPLTKTGISLLRRAACTRRVALAIGEYQINKQYYEMGYRWWHILPDGFPWLVLKLKWWKTFF